LSAHSLKTNCPRAVFFADLDSATLKHAPKGFFLFFLFEYLLTNFFKNNNFLGWHLGCLGLGLLWVGWWG
jgi:hypothetical protein